MRTGWNEASRIGLKMKKRKKREEFQVEIWRALMGSREKNWRE